MAKPTKHIFVCTHERPAGDLRGSCKQAGGAAVLDAMRGELFNNDLMPDIKATKSGCLGGCESGVIVVVYPDNVWYSKVQVEDVVDIIEDHIMDDDVVERLLMDMGE
jgi:(2Fe-2S) ferredoxin